MWITHPSISKHFVSHLCKFSQRCCGHDDTTAKIAFMLITFNLISHKMFYPTLCLFPPNYVLETTSKDNKRAIIL